MASTKQPKMGYDPLAWMNEGEESAAVETAPAPAAKRRSRRPSQSDAEPGLNVTLLEESFNALAPHGAELVGRFYEELFRRYPDVRPLFAGTTPESQQGKLLAALKLVVNSLRKPAVLEKALTELGARHQDYGALPEHYPAVATTLLDVMSDMAGELWTPEVEKAWSDALQTIADVMLKAYGTEGDKAMAASKKALEEHIGEQGEVTVMDDLDVMKSILEYAPLNIMIADADENIVFVNKRARDILTELEGDLAQYLPGFTAAAVVGGSIHRYHKDPSAIKRILHGLQPGDVRQGEITPGPFVFEHETRVLVNSAGERMGYVVQWHDVTEARQKQEQAQRLQTAIDGAQTAMMTIDRDLVITYVNAETEDLMQRNGDVLRRLYPGFDPGKLLGTCIDIFHKNPAHQRQLLADPGNLPYETDIQVGPLTFHIRVSAIHNLGGDYVGNTLEWADVTELRRSETNVARLQSAIDGSTTALMLCDSDLNITYVNPAVVDLLEHRRDQLRQVFPGFDPQNLVNQSIDQFHRNPKHQRAILTDPSRLPFTGNIKLLDLEFQVNATAILDQNGDYMGNMVEWKDITEQKDAERQIEGLINAATLGELNNRINTGGYQGFMKGLGDGINTLMDTVVVPIQEGTRVMQSLADGDLSQQMEGEFQGEFAVLRDAINATLNNLYDIVGKIRESAGSISSAASEIAQGNQDLSQRTEEQASSLEETASSMEQLTSTVKQNADNARQANQLASGAREQAEKGGHVVSNAISAMSEINASSKKIADIIGVIDEIAFQTNLLALNAAVEAARAGEQGRGFAVVATEVRNLAQRSAAAAKEIKALIKDSVEKVEDGSRLVNESGATLDEIVNAVKKVSDIIAEIAAASTEQSAGIEQVNKAVMQMDEVTQQNAALVEEAAAASESLDDQAHGLTELMGFFDIGSDEPEPPVTRTRSARRPAPPPARPAARRERPAPAPRRRPQPRAQDTEDDEWEEF